MNTNTNCVSKNIILKYLKSKKSLFTKKYGITELGLYGSYARNEAGENSDVDIFYKRNSSFHLNSGLDFWDLSDSIAKDLNVKKLDFTNLSSMNPVIKYYAKKDFIYV